ncbi:phosphatase [Bacteroidia bacterium]|nr:phosphatase [Bacteroidia bacterium]
MSKQTAFLFDLDGVIIDTEPQYDIFWSKAAEKYRLGIDHFEQIIKGTTLPNILDKYFSHFPEEKQKEVVKAIQDFELQMEILPIPGALEFLNHLRKENKKTGLVTSSDDKKLEYVFRKLPIRHYFDTVVSADRITQGKPNPMCYLLAAKDLGIAPEDCYVFEDSINGIKAGNAAGMKVIGLSTTLPAERIQDNCMAVLPDFLKIPAIL